MKSRKLAKYIKLTGITVDTLEDIPTLVEALEEFGQFKSARKVTRWYNQMNCYIDEEWEDVDALGYASTI